MVIEILNSEIVRAVGVLLFLILLGLIAWQLRGIRRTLAVATSEEAMAALKRRAEHNRAMVVTPEGRAALTDFVASEAALLGFIEHSADDISSHWADVAGDEPPGKQDVDKAWDDFTKRIRARNEDEAKRDGRGFLGAVFQKGWKLVKKAPETLLAKINEMAKRAARLVIGAGA